MDYKIITNQITSQKLSIPILAEKIGMSKRGLYAALKNKTLNVQTLEQIAQVLNVPISEFFNTDSEGSIGGISVEEFQGMKDLLQKKEEIINQLSKENQMLTDLRKNCEEKLAQKRKEYKMLDRFFEAAKIGKYGRWDDFTHARVYSFTQTLLKEGELGAYRLARKLGDEDLLLLLDFVINDEEPPMST